MMERARFASSLALLMAVASTAGAVACSSNVSPADNTSSEPTTPEPAVATRSDASSSNAATNPEATLAPVATFRTARGGIHIRVRLENPGGQPIEVKVTDVEALSSPAGATAVTSVMMSSVPLDDPGATSVAAGQAADGWITAPPRTSSILTIFVDHAAPPWDGHSEHRYRVGLETRDGSRLVSEATLTDAVRRRR